jgi:hypothetical protein
MSENEFWIKENPLIRQANEALRLAKKNRLFILLDKFGNTGRVSYDASVGLSETIPDIVVSEYRNDHALDDQINISIEDEEGEVGKNSSIHLSNLMHVLNNNTSGKHPYYATWYLKDQYEEILSKYGGTLSAMDNPTRNIIENKTFLSQYLQEAGVSEVSNRLYSVCFRNGEELPDYSSLTQVFGNKFVLQGTSKGGDGTFIIRNLYELQNALPLLKGDVRISLFEEGFYSTIYAFNLPNNKKGCNTFVDLPSHKAVNIPHLGISETFGAGGDWSIGNNLKNPNRLVEQVSQIGMYLHQQFGLKGAWCIEGFIGQDGNFRFNEINARLGGGSEVSGINQLLANFVPFQTLHHLLFLNGDTSWIGDSDNYNNHTINELKSLSKPKPFYLKIFSTRERSCRVVNNLRNGKHSLESNIGTFDTNKSTSPLSCNFDNGEFLICNLPSANTLINPGSQLCTIEGMATNNHIFDSPNTLSTQAEIVSNLILSNVI